jgi:hypothetical protein
MINSKFFFFFSFFFFLAFYKNDADTMIIKHKIIKLTTWPEEIQQHKNHRTIYLSQSNHSRMQKKKPTTLQYKECLYMGRDFYKGITD